MRQYMVFAVVIDDLILYMKILSLLCFSWAHNFTKNKDAKENKN